MAKKKGLDDINTGSIYAGVNKGTKTEGQQTEPSEEEINERRSELRTQGRKGCEAIRINMAITPENHEFLASASKIMGMSITKYANYIIEKYRKEHAEAYEDIKNLKSRL